MLHGKIEAVLTQLQRSVEVTLCRPDGEADGLTAKLALLAQELAEASPSVTLAPDKLCGDGIPACPALLLGRPGEPPVVRYQALPEGLEVPPFARALGILGGATEPALGRESLAADQQGAADLMVFVSPTCPHCPQAAATAMELALGPGAVVTTVVDASRFPQLAASYGVRSVPLTVLDGGQSFVGVVEAEVILQALAQRDSDDYEGTLFQSLLDSGRHAEAAQRLIGGTARSWWLEAWRESAMSQRIGLLLVAEEALALEASVLDGLLPELQTLAVQAADPSLRGDTADLLGKIGHPAARPALVQACNDENAEVAEVAREALEELDESTRTTNGSGRG